MESNNASVSNDYTQLEALIMAYIRDKAKIRTLSKAEIVATVAGIQ